MGEKSPRHRRSSSAGKASFSEALAFLWRQRAAFHVIMASGVCSLWGWGLVWWTPTFLLRAYGLNVAHGILSSHHSGLIVEPALDDVRDAVVRLFDEPDTCARFGQAGAARFRAEFTDARFRARFALVVPAAGVPPRPAADRCA